MSVSDTGADVVEYHSVVEQSGELAVDCLHRCSALSKQKLKQAMQKGCVWLEHRQGAAQAASIQRLRRAKKPLQQGDQLHFYYNPSVLQSVPAAAVLVHDAGDYSIWNKPSGMLSQGSKWGDHCTVYRWAEQHLSPQRPAFIVHRLDRAANGLIILAHKKKVAAQLSKMFEQRQLKKHYRVTVVGDFSQQLAAGESQVHITEQIDGKPASSHVQLLKYDAQQQHSYLEVKIETGRKHQIRKHLMGLGYPVLGDRLYGTPEPSLDLQLQAAFLSFECPVSAQPVEYRL